MKTIVHASYMMKTMMKTIVRASYMMKTVMPPLDYIWNPIVVQIVSDINLKALLRIGYSVGLH